MDIFDLSAKITLDTSGYERSIEDAGKKTSGFSTKSVIAGKLIADGIEIGIKAIADFAKQSIAAYADYEQLVGGVETLFKNNADVVQQYAENAYKTAGMSANEYMETVTGFSASLLQSLGGDTAAAAKAADLAITDMSDNANKMGTSIDSIKTAYAGFAKQNYTMLDNLKLGYGGTKQEMERLLADAEAFSGVHYDITSLNDVYSAIHVVQTELGITGTTALEASTTISGSAASMKAAWSNLLTGMADENADFSSLVGTFTESLITYADNLMPRIGQAVDGVGQLLSAFAETVLPKIIDYIVSDLPNIISTGINIVVKLAEGLIKAIPQLVQKIPQIITAIVSGLRSAIPELLNVGKNMIKGVWDGIVSMGSWIKEKVKGFFSGVVGSVKEFLGIHSPSKVFAGIGGYMAEGLGVGWEDEYADVKKKITNGLDFGDARVGVVGNVSGITSANSIVAGDSMQTINIVVDGDILSSVVVDRVRKEVRMA